MARRTAVTVAGIFLVAVLAGAGCANVTTTEIIRRGDDLVINSGKDVSIGALSYSNGNGETLTVSNYTSNANAEAIRSQGAREVQMLQEIRGLVKDTFERGAKSVIPAP